MLVTLATNQALSAGSTTTFTYSPTSFSKAFLKFDDDAGDQTTTWVTIQLGSRTIVNDVQLYQLIGYQNLYCNYTQADADTQCAIDCGTWQLMNSENLYITIRVTNAQNAVDVSAIVDEASLNPVQYTTYSDNVFTAENVLCAMGSKSNGSSIEEDVTAVTIRNSIMSSSPAVASGVSYMRAEAQGGGNDGYSLLYKERVPHTTSFNYSSSATMDQLLIAQSIPYTASQLRQAKNQSFINRAFAS